MTAFIPNILSIAGVDPSGGAGILADVKAMSALGGYGCAVVAAMTAQNTQGVTDILPVPPEFVAAQIDTLLDDMTIHAAKIGMLSSAPIIEAVVETLAKRPVPHLVLDPVMVSKSGHMLLEAEAVSQLREALLPLVTLMTPNLPEGGVLTETRAPENLREMYVMAEKLRRLMNDDAGNWVLLKGGHLPGSDTTDLLYDGDVMLEYPGRRIDTPNTHGTGCTLSAALATLLGLDHSVPDATHLAKAYLVKAIRRSGELDVGKGQGPVHHFHALWP